jgi:hypothetical protein
VVIKQTENSMLFEIGDHFAAIRAAWRSTTSSIYEVAKACRAAEEGLTVDQKRELLKQLPFSAATFSKYLSIAYDENLADPEMRSQLPPLFSVLYLLSTFKKAELDAFRQEVGLRPDLKSQKVETWLKKHRAAKLEDLATDDLQAPAMVSAPAPVISERDNPLSVVHDIRSETEAVPRHAGATCTLKIQIVNWEIDKLLALYSDLAGIAMDYGVHIEGLPPDLGSAMLEAA